MKPPARSRNRTVRHDWAASQRPLRPGKWKISDRMKLLKGLKRNLKLTAAEGEISYDLLRKYLPLISVPEIQSMVESMKDRVVNTVNRIRIMKKSEEKRLRKPIEKWTEMASSVTGRTEAAISAALCQVLMVCSTEPCSTRNGQSFQVSRIPAPGSAISLNPPVHRKDPPVTTNGTPTSVDLPTPPGDAPSRSFPGASRPPPPNQQVPGPQTPTSSSSVQPNTTNLVSSPSSNLEFKNSSSPQRTPGSKYVVDFENIYKFLSEIPKPNEELSLTALESAIMLDLLMCLPEELPLLDCEKLENHMLQANKHLSLFCEKTDLLTGRVLERQSGDSSVPSGKSVERSVPSGKSVERSVPSGQSRESSVPSGQSRESSVPSGQSVERSVPSGQSVERSVPSGQSRESNAPPGQSGESNTPSGQSGESSVPSGQSGKSSAPSGQSGDSSVPSGQSGESSVPSGQSRESNAPSGQSGESSAPPGQSQEAAAFAWCSPLNPFNVPIKLLRRKQVESRKNAF